jgi:ketosteroid isomerase-like protein
MSSNTDTVMGMYAAFGRGDLDHILAQLSDDVSWDEGLRHTGLSYLVPGTGKQHVAGFFGALAQNIEFTRFEPGVPCASDDTVMVAVREAGRNIVTGAPLGDETVVHIWTFDPSGKVTAFRHVGDFAVHEAAARSVATAAAN